MKRREQWLAEVLRMLVALLVLATVSALAGCAKPETRQPDEIALLKNEQIRTRKLIHAGAEGGYLASQTGMPLSEYLSMVDARLNKLFAQELSEERQKLAKKMILPNTSDEPRQPSP